MASQPPAMRIVQVLHWLQDTLQSDAPRVRRRLRSVFADPTHRPAITADLRDGLSTLPTGMQIFLRDLIIYGAIATDRQTNGDSNEPDSFLRSVRG